MEARRGHKMDPLGVGVKIVSSCEGAGNETQVGFMEE